MLKISLVDDRLQVVQTVLQLLYSHVCASSLERVLAEGRDRVIVVIAFAEKYHMKVLIHDIDQYLGAKKGSSKGTSTLWRQHSEAVAWAKLACDAGLSELSKLFEDYATYEYSYISDSQQYRAKDVVEAASVLAPALLLRILQGILENNNKRGTFSHSAAWICSKLQERL